MEGRGLFGNNSCFIDRSGSGSRRGKKHDEE